MMVDQWEAFWEHCLDLHTSNGGFWGFGICCWDFGLGAV